jgi:23S rRNA pseudouridine2605 synthase
VPTSNAPAAQRIAKLLARAGIASRREIERMIAEGRVALNGAVLDTPATVLTSLEGVTVDGNPVEAPAPARLFRYHKPAGLLTAERDFTGRPTIYDRLPDGLPRVMPVGRLDLNTEGLLLLTTDGELKRQLELPSVGVERSYRARAYGSVSQAQLEDLMLGIEIEGVRYGSINANLERRTGANMWVEMTLTEGKNREVRRVLEFLGLQVSRLIRTRYGPFHLGDLPPGDVDEVRAADLTVFRTVLAKPGGGKAASNLQFAVRQRVAPNPPKNVSVNEPERRVPRPDDRPGRVPAKPPRTAAPERPREERRPRPDAPPESRGRSGARQDRSREDRKPADARAAKFTPRGTPAPRTERPRRDEPVANPGRAARAKAHRDTREPRAGDLVDRPGKPRAHGPSGGRGKPAKPARPKPTRK